MQSASDSTEMHTHILYTFFIHYIYTKINENLKIYN